MYQNHLVKPRKPKKLMGEFEGCRDSSDVVHINKSHPDPAVGHPHHKNVGFLATRKGRQSPASDSGTWTRNLLHLSSLSQLQYNQFILTPLPLHVPLPAPAWSSRQSHTHCAALQPVQSTLQVCPKKPRGRRPPPRGGLHTHTAVYTPAGAALLVSGRLAAVVMPLRSGMTPLRSRPNK